MTVLDDAAVTEGTGAARPTVGAPHPLHRVPPGSDVVELVTVGIDVGSATYHLSVSRVVLARRSQELSTRYDVVAREAVVTSPVFFTPYLDDGTIDAGAVDETVRRCYAEAAVHPAEIESGVVLLTGSALERRNARTLADRLATHAGRFVCAAAGHHFEAVLAAHGSGAVARSAAQDAPVVAMDVGGATTKLALAVGGEVRATTALGVGGRLLAWDAVGRLTRVEPAAVTVAGALGIDVAPGIVLGQPEVDAICEAMARAVVHQLAPAIPAEGASGRVPVLGDAFPTPGEPFTIVASGGVAEYLEPPSKPPQRRRAPADAPLSAAHQDAGHPDAGHPGADAADVGDAGDAGDAGDLGRRLARALRDGLSAAGLGSRLERAEHRIRATVLGASRFSTQVSGSTIAVDVPSVLPLHHVPVVRAPLADELRDAAPDAGRVARAVTDALAARFEAALLPDELAVSVRWQGAPSHPRLRAVAEGVLSGVRAAGFAGPLVVAVDRDLASSLGRILTEELDADRRSLVCLDEIELADFDYVDVGIPSRPANVVPVVVKSLLFGASDPLAPAPTAGPTSAAAHGRAGPHDSTGGVR